MLIVLLLLLPIAGGCHNQSEKSKILVFAAASSNDAVSEICNQFESQSNINVQTSFAGSSTLATQILNGAQADLFLSANLPWIEKLQSEDKVNQVNRIIGNQLVVISAIGDKPDWQPKQLEDLVDHRIVRIAIADPDSVPAGIYAKQALESTDIWNQTRQKCVYSAHVRQTLSQVESKAVDIGIVYKTDAKISSNVQVLFEIPHELTGAIEYGLALTEHGQEDDPSQQLYEFFNSKFSNQVFKKHGFVVSEGAR